MQKPIRMCIVLIVVLLAPWSASVAEQKRQSPKQSNYGLVREETYENGKKVSGRSRDENGNWHETTREQLQAEERKKAQAQIEQADRERNSREKYDLSDGKKLAVMIANPGLSAGFGGGRAGIALEWAILSGGTDDNGRFSRDFFKGYFLSVGARGFSPEAYTVGFGKLYFKSSWDRSLLPSTSSQADLLIRNGRIEGGMLTKAAGISSDKGFKNFFLSARIGFLSNQAIAELGVSFGIPLGSFKF
ncbi:MAG: hypothetical protein KGQ59_00650 [Bdellovibrionales bacterium]|nr:hypothetical protein [Bdellovibrionales bacterium]